MVYWSTAGRRCLPVTWLRALMRRYTDFWQVTEAALVYACKRVGVTDDPAVRAALMEKYLHLGPYPEVAAALEQLKDYTLAILSNGTPGMLESVVSNAGLRQHFAAIISADEVKSYKPDPRIYELAPRKLDLPKESILFVSANPWDVAGAKSYGFNVCRLNRFGSQLEELEAGPDLIVEKLTSIPGQSG